jgi:MFS family permease
LVPLCSYTCSLLFTVYVQAKLTQRLRNRLAIMSIAAVVIFVSTLPYAFLTTDPRNNWLVYPLAAMQGTGIAMILNTSTSLISDVVGRDSKQAAFVYGFYSLLDKWGNGFMLFFLVKDYSASDIGLRVIVTLIPILSGFGTLFFTWLGMKLYGGSLAKISFV